MEVDVDVDVDEDVKVSLDGSCSSVVDVEEAREKHIAVVVQAGTSHWMYIHALYA